MQTMAASMRTWLLLVALACALLLSRSADAQAQAGDAQGPSVAAVKPKCEPGATKPCRVGAVHDPENQEEEGIFSVNVKVPDGAADDADSNDYSDPDLPHDDSSLVVLGH